MESGIHAAFTEVLDSLNQPEVLASLSKLVKAQAIVGVEAAINEGMLLMCLKQSRASPVVVVHPYQNRTQQAKTWLVQYMINRCVQRLSC